MDPCIVVWLSRNNQQDFNVLMKYIAFPLLRIRIFVGLNYIF